MSRCTAPVRGIAQQQQRQPPALLVATAAVLDPTTPLQAEAGVATEALVVVEGLAEV